MTRKLRRIVGAALTAAIVPLVVASCGDDHAYVNNTRHTDAAPDVRRYPDASAPDVADVEAPDAGVSLNMWPPSAGPIQYWGGPVMLGTPNVYFVWYGDWSGNNTPAILEDLIKGFGQTGYSSVLSMYYQTSQDLDAGEDETKEYVSGDVAFSRSIYVGYSRTSSLHKGDVQEIVTDLLQAGSLPYDPNGVYFLLTSKDVTETIDDGWGQFCEVYCGYHDSVDVNGLSIKYSLVGDPGRCPENCIPQATLFAELGLADSPNANWRADAMASVLIHELSEAITDPEPLTVPAWLDAQQRYENADMCAWRFEPTYPTLNGSRANARFGGRDYLIQQTWVPDIYGGHCALDGVSNVQHVVHLEHAVQQAPRARLGRGTFRVFR